MQPGDALTLGLVEVFILLFVTLGPLKVVGPFAHATSASDESGVRDIALRAFALSLTCVVVAGFGGAALLSNWHVSMGALTLAGGIIFFLVAIRQLLMQYDPPHGEPAHPAAPPMVAARKITFPTVVTPYGIAAVIALFAASAQGTRIEMIVALLVVIMLLNLAAMVYVRRILNGATALVLQLIGAVLGVLQVALSVQIVLRGLRELGLLIP